MDEREALEHKIWFFKKIGFFAAEMSDRTPIKLQLDDLSPDDPVRVQAENRKMQEAEVPNFCPGCGRAVGREDSFCPSCGKPSKKLQAAAVEREQQPERPALSYDLIEPRLMGRLNIPGITAEIYDDQSVVVLTPHAVSVTFNKLGSEAMGAFEIRLTAVREKEETGKAAAPTSLVTPSKGLNGS